MPTIHLTTFVAAPPERLRLAPNCVERVPITMFREAQITYKPQQCAVTETAVSTGTFV